MRKAVRAIVIYDNKLLVMHRNKFGQEYYTLVGGGIDAGETAEQSLLREVWEESGLHVHSPQLVFVEEAGHPFGVQYIYLCQYQGGDVTLMPHSEEAKIHALGQNLYTPMWLPLSDLHHATFISEKLKHTILHALKSGFPSTPQYV